MDDPIEFWLNMVESKEQKQTAPKKKGGSDAESNLAETRNS